MNTVPSIDCPLCGYRAIPLHDNHYQCPNDCDYLCYPQPIMGASETGGTGVKSPDFAIREGADSEAPAKLLAALKQAREALSRSMGTIYNMASDGNHDIRNSVADIGGTISAIDAVMGDMGVNAGSVVASKIGTGSECMKPDAPTYLSPNDCTAADNKTKIPVPTEDELQELVTAKWKEIKPSHEAQKIRSGLSFDSGKYNQPDCDFVPSYVWDIADIAAQKAIDLHPAPVTQVDEVERVAKAIFPWHHGKYSEGAAWERMTENVKQAYRDQAKAAIAAMPRPDDRALLEQVREKIKEMTQVCRHDFVDVGSQYQPEDYRNMAYEVLALIDGKLAEGK